MGDNETGTQAVLCSWMSAEHHDVEGLLRIRVYGELDLSTVDAASATLTGLVRSSDSDVVLDLAEAGFVAVAGIRLFAAVADCCHADGRSFALTGVSGVLCRMLVVCRLEHLIA